MERNERLILMRMKTSHYLLMNRNGQMNVWQGVLPQHCYRYFWKNFPRVYIKVQTAKKRNFDFSHSADKDKWIKSSSRERVRGPKILKSHSGAVPGGGSGRYHGAVQGGTMGRFRAVPWGGSGRYWGGTGRSSAVLRDGRLWQRSAPTIGSHYDATHSTIPQLLIVLLKTYLQVYCISINLSYDMCNVFLTVVFNPAIPSRCVDVL